MMNLISGAIAHLASLFQGFQVKRCLGVVLAGFLLLTSHNIDPSRVGASVNRTLNNAVHQGDSERPKTTGEWQKEARETKGSPGDRLERIVDESADAVKDWGKLYPNTAERSGEALKEDTSVGRALSR